MSEEICGATCTTTQTNICQLPKGHKGLHLDDRDGTVEFDDYVCSHPKFVQAELKRLGALEKKHEAV